MHWTESTHTQCVQYTLFEFGHGLYFFCPFIILIIIIISFCAKRVFISVPFVWIFFSSSGQCFAVRCAHNVKISRYWCVRKSLSASVRWALAFMRSRHTQVKKPLCAKLNDSNLKNNFFFFRSRIFNRNILNLPEFFFLFISCYQKYIFMPIYYHSDTVWHQLQWNGEQRPTARWVRTHKNEKRANGFLVC